VTLAALSGWLAAVVAVGLWFLLQRLSAARMEAVVRACHELRGPLTAARLGLELGTRGQGLSSTQARAIDTELGRATLALDDLAAVPSGRTPAMRWDDLELVELTSISAEAWRPAAEAAGVRLEWIVPNMQVWLTGDAGRLAQAIGNLIANAIEHGGKRAEVRVRWQRDLAQVEVADDGPGLAEPLDALARRARNGQGSRGRGLVIAANVAALHQGRLEAVSGGPGARLVLTLPLG
jgi:signal transduction histidine kinase